MKVQHFIPIVCSVLVGCHTDSGVNPPPYSTSRIPSYKCDYRGDLPDCDEKMEGIVFVVRAFSSDKLFVCSDKMWIYLRDASKEETDAVPKYTPVAEKGSEILVEKGYVVDHRDGITYRTVKIGNQEWFAENLEYGYSSYEDYNGICFMTSGSRGCLYTWRNVMNADLSPDDLCPNGFHVPSKDDWDILIKKAGGYENAGLALQANDGISKDSYSFSIYPSGYYDSDASYSRDRYSLADSFAPFWTSTFTSSSNAYAVLFNQDDPQVRIQREHISDGYAIRCLKD